MNKLFRCLAVVAALTTSSLMAGSQLFEVSATTTDTLPTLNLTAGSSNFVDFSQDLLNSAGQFQTLSGRAFDASLKFLGVSNAILVSTNAGNSVVTITFTPIGVSKSFADTPQKDATDQFVDYFKTDGTDVIARFLKAIAKQSEVALSDGNPNSATAGAAANVFLSQGFTPVDEMIGLDSAGTTTTTTTTSAAGNKPRFSGFALGFNSSRFKAGPFDGTNSEFSYSKTIFRYVSLSGNFDYLTIDDAKVYGAGLNLAVPIRINQMDKDHPVSWRITPLLGASVRGSVDMANVAPIWEVGLVNSVDYRLNPKLVLCLVNQLTMHKSFSLNYDNINVDPQIDQLITKNGVRFVTPLNRRLILDGFLVDTRFLKDALVKSFETIGGSISLRATTSMNLTLGANYDTGSDYKAYSAGLSSAWKW